MVISLFSGQGSQYQGMGKDIAEKDPELISLYDKASDIIGKDLKNICFEADEAILGQTANS
ncbi:MAG: ACP S-malonyltransferase, partial [Ruminococcus sp.]|nr:ACP S-malonyltransferase [Ruminococcus sp.]